jgi:hypothetical protein
LWNALKRQDFPVLDFPAGRQLRLAGAKVAPGGKDATRRIKGRRLGVYWQNIREPKWKSRMKLCCLFRAL